MKIGGGRRLSVRFYKYFMTYTIFLMIVLLSLGGLTYGRTNDLLRRNVEGAGKSVMTQVQLMIENRLKEMERIALQLPLNSNLSAHALAGGYESYQVLKEIRMYTAGNMFIYDMAIVYGVGDEREWLVLGLGGSSDMELFLQKGYRVSRQRQEAVIAHVRESKQPVMLPADRADSPDSAASAEPYTLYVYPLPGSRPESMRFVLFVISEQQLKGMIQSALEGYSGYASIFDEHGEPMFSAAFGDFDAQPGFALADAINYASASIGKEEPGQALTVARVKSERNGWTYMLAPLERQFLAETAQIRRVFLLTVAVVLAAGLLLSYWFAIHNYKPWRKLIQTMQLKSPHPAFRDDEISIVSRAVDHLARENDDLSHKLKSKNRPLKEQYVFWSLQGEADRMSRASALIDNPLFLSAKPVYAVVRFHIDRYAQFIGDNSEAEQELLKFGMINIIEELAEELGNGFCLELPDHEGMALVLNLDRRSADTRSLKELAAKAAKVYAQYYKYSLSAGVGGCYEDIRQLQLSFREAGAASQYVFYKGIGHVTAYREIADAYRRPYRYPSNMETQLVIALKQANSRVAEQAVRQIADSLQRHGVAPDTARAVWRDLARGVVKGMDELSPSVTEALQLALGSLDERGIATLAEMREAWVGVCADLCARLRERRESKNFGLLEQIMAFVDERYADNTLSLDVIAERFSRSPSYMTRFFKDHTGYPLIQYIDRRRMEKAKQLLRGTDLSIGEIVEAAGYVDEANFRRKFRKLQGIPPSLFRRDSRSNDSRS